VAFQQESFVGGGGAASVDGEPRLSVAYFCPAWPPDGQANGIVKYVNEISQGLRRRGHTTTLLINHYSGPRDPADAADTYDLGEFRKSRTLLGRVAVGVGVRMNRAHTLEQLTCRSIAKAARLAVADRGVQILEMEESFGWPRLIQPRLPVPMVVRLHGPWFLNGAVQNVPEDSEFRRRVRLEGEAIRLADGVSASSRDVLEQTRAYYGIPLERAEVIYPPGPIIPDEACWKPADFEPQSVLFVGRFDRHKGADLTIEAFGLVAARFPEARLRIVGPDRGGFTDDDGRSWNILDFIRDRIRDPGIRDRIKWLGLQPNSAVMDLRRKALVSVVSSRYDNFPTTVTEAMSMGCPIVANRTGGIPEQISHESNGLLCKPGDTTDLADQIGRLLSDPALAARLGQQARLDSESLLSVATLSAKMVAFYGRVLDEFNTRKANRS
jgi:glycosyltransferase involved in cell wall biosynthesis